MVTILIISDDPRAQLVVQTLQPQCRGKLRLAADFDNGLKEVFDNRPSAVFIQGNISGISGETVARHIKTLLRTESPRIILLYDALYKQQGGKKWFDESVDYSLADHELVAAFRKQLAKIDGIEMDAEREVAASGAAATEIDMVLEGNGDVPAPTADSPPLTVPAAETEVPAPAAPAPIPEDVAPPTRQRAVSPPAPEPVREKTFAEKLEQMQASPLPAEPPRKEQPPPHSPPPLKSQLSPPDSGGQSLEGSVPPVGPDLSHLPEVDLGVTAPSSGAKVKAALVLLLVVAVGVGYYLFSYPGKGETGKQLPPPTAQPAQPAVKPAEPSPASPATVDRTRLPSFIPGKKRDAAFAAANPGWERYLSGGREYRVFREKGMIRAIQVISVGDRIINKEFLLSALAELTGTASYTVSGREQKGGYLVENGSVAGKAEIQVYRKKKKPGIRAFVISLT